MPVRRTSVVAALAAALVVPLASPAQAAREPEPPAWAGGADQPEWDDGEEPVWLGEGETGRHGGGWDDEHITVLEGRWVLTVVNQQNGTGGEYRWFHTGGGSRFYLNYCDDQGMYAVRVSRTRFFRRALGTLNHWTIRYDAERNRGTFLIDSDVEKGDPCVVRERRAGDRMLRGYTPNPT